LRNGNAESHYKMTYDCNVGLIYNTDPLFIDIENYRTDSEKKQMTR